MRKRAVSALHSFFSVALDLGAIDVDPSRRIKLRLMDREENVSLLKAAGISPNAKWLDIAARIAARAGRRTEADRELERRLVVRLRKCRTREALQLALRESVAAGDS